MNGISYHYMPLEGHNKFEQSTIDNLVAKVMADLVKNNAFTVDEIEEKLEFFVIVEQVNGLELFFKIGDNNYRGTSYVRTHNEVLQ